MEKIGVVHSLASTFADIKGNRKGFALPSMFLQVLTNFIDGTTRSLIECSTDGVVYDNDDAVTREGVRPTYKKVKGFQPLSVLWNGFTIWSEFRDGSTNGNNGTDETGQGLFDFACPDQVILTNINLVGGAGV